MSDLSRRDAVKMVAGLTMGAMVTGDINGEENKKVADPLLDSARKWPWSFRIIEQVTFKTSPTQSNLFFTSAHAPGHLPKGIRLLLGSMYVFRAETDHDEFTRQGGLYWECGKTKGKVQFKQKGTFNQQGALVMAIRDLEGTVNCYSLEPDLRC
ncbi:hypothetical protein [Gimesia aquarii]|uniref:Uncharacterized protein n=1 Tax=Gimesia aquarii TaxID=2527964 RepID=A0A517VSD1_9PLAN|nr:hypothetical protein [Gimesia aquarii]QDT95859.1 hypothetical protein V144x_13070 [Gimesia aquarii]